MFHGGAQECDGGLVGLGILVYHALGHLGIAVDALEVLVASGLDVAGLDDAFADDGAGFGSNNIVVFLTIQYYCLSLRHE